jgi:nitrite reductase (NADH) small subunit
MTAASGDRSPERHWEPVCPVADLLPERGAAALVAGRQVALFRLVDAASGAETVYAVDNLDPCSGAAVLSRGIVGDRAGRPVVASPVYKQAFSLEDGRCLDEPGQEVEVFSVQVIDGWVRVGLT